MRELIFMSSDTIFGSSLGHDELLLECMETCLKLGDSLRVQFAIRITPDYSIGETPSQLGIRRQLLLDLGSKLLHTKGRFAEFVREGPLLLEIFGFTR
jgi:hypothetical protein